MCGIVGIIYKDAERQVSEFEVICMRDLLAHRGPDDQGILVDGNMGMGHRRLSIIDLHTGHQPMANEDETLWIVFNGEIYNFQEIREDLVKKGHTFTTRSDTEVILHLYEEKGVNCPAFLNGIFAFAIWDKKKRSLFLARDHMGIKPLYYAETKDSFLFSSEIKSIVRSGHMDARCNEAVLPEYFLFRHISGENTIFQGVKNLLPAHSMVYKTGKSYIREYWSPFPREIETDMSFEAATEKLDWLIKDSVKKQLISDVPLGTFCSGGVDSSLVTALAARFSTEPINTFSVGFYEKGYDETAYARMVSKKYGTRHHEIKLTNQEFADLLPKMIWHNDEPLNFANSIQIYAISKLAKGLVTVVLTGEGADELFGGYPRYLVPKMAEWCKRLPQSLRKLIARNSRWAGGHRIEKVIRFSSYPSREAYLLNASFLDKDFVRSIVNQFPDNGFLFREESLKRGEALSLDPINCLSLIDQQNYLVSILNRQDKMSMATSLESRVPLLDYRIVNFANSMHSMYKVRSLKTKLILKAVAGKYLPPPIINRRKSGFGVPLGLWFRESMGLGSLLAEMAAEIRPGGFIKKKKFIKIVKEHKAGEQDHSEILWTCINFWLWEKKFLASNG